MNRTSGAGELPSLRPQGEASRREAGLLPPSDRRRGGSDRRETERRPFVAAVRHEPRAGRMHLGQAANLGPLGMQVRRRVHTAEPALPAQAEVQVSFALPDGGELMHLEAQVVFDEPQGGAHHLTGLRFQDLPPEAAARLQRFLDR